MIIFLTTENHRFTHQPLEGQNEVTVQVMGYNEIEERAGRLPAGTFVFTDMDRLHPSQLHTVAIYYRRIRDVGRRVLNDPARVLSRFGLLRALNRAGINQFDAYRIEDLEGPRQWPVFLRVEGNHAMPVSGLLRNQTELDNALRRCAREGYPRSGLLMIEYAAEPVQPGIFRKLSAFRVGDRILGHTCVHDDKWLVKYGKPGFATPQMYDEEYDFVANDRFADALRPVFDIAGVDYGRVDFGLVGGRPQIYEINSNPDVKFGVAPNPVQRRNESVALFESKYLAALRAIEAPAGIAVTKADSVPAG